MIRRMLWPAFARGARPRRAREQGRLRRFARRNDHHEACEVADESEREAPSGLPLSHPVKLVSPPVEHIGYTPDTHLTGNCKSIRAIHAFDDPANVLHGRHQGRKLIRVQILETRDDAAWDDQHVCSPASAMGGGQRVLHLALTSGNDGLEVDDGACKRGAVKGLASDVDRREQQVAHRRRQ